MNKRKYTERIPVNFTKKQKLEVKRAAKKEGLRSSEYIRVILFEEVA